jgi:hypothetical protein
MEILAQIPFSLDFDQIAGPGRVDAGSSDAADLLALIELAQEIGKPKAAYAVRFIEERDGDTVQIDGIRLRSRTLAHNLKSVERVFPLVATCGRELDEAFPGKGDMLKEFWWDLIKTNLLGAAGKHLSTRFHKYGNV